MPTSAVAPSVIRAAPMVPHAAARLSRGSGPFAMIAGTLRVALAVLGTARRTDLGTGLTDEAVHRRLEWLAQPTTGLEILQELEIGDQVLAASGGPQPRVLRGGWANATLAEASLWRVTSGYEYDTTIIWLAPPDPRRSSEHWPHRLGIELDAEFRDVTRAQVGLAGMDALH